MKKYWIFVFFVLLSGMVFAQSRFTVNLNGGFDFNSNKYYNANGYSKFENGQNDFNFGLDLGFRFSKLVRARIEVRYTELSYGQRPTSPADILETEMTLSNMDINPRLDFHFYTYKKFDFYLSPGLRFEYIVNSNQKSEKSDGTISRRNYISTDYNDRYSGFIGGAIVRYNLTKRLGFTFAPDYTIFFNHIYEQSDKTMQRFNANLGVEFVL